MKNLLYLFLFFAFFSCKSSHVDSEDLSYIKANTWQWDSGFKVGEGDMLSFDKDSKVFKIENDIIYFKNEPRALIKSVNKKKLKLTITSLDKKSTGVYINIEEYTR